MVRQEGLEPPTVGLEVRCSVLLSYWRVPKKLSEFIADPGFYHQSVYHYSLGARNCQDVFPLSAPFVA